MSLQPPSRHCRRVPQAPLCSVSPTSVWVSAAWLVSGGCIRRLSRLCTSNRARPAGNSPHSAPPSSVYREVADLHPVRTSVVAACYICARPDRGTVLTSHPPQAPSAQLSFAERYHSAFTSVHIILLTPYISIVGISFRCYASICSACIL